MKNRESTLLKNTLIYMIGNFSSQILSILLIPIFSYFIEPSDLGFYDLTITLLTMGYIVFSLQSVESSFRFSQECKTEIERKTVLSNSLAISIFGAFFLVLALLVIQFIFPKIVELVYFIYISSYILANLFLQTLRGQNRIKLYAQIGVFTTALTSLLNFILIVHFKYGARSLIISPIIVNLFVIFFSLFIGRLAKQIDFSLIKASIIGEYLLFTLPLIPNALSIWLLGSIGRFIIFNRMNAESIGIFVFSQKYPMLLMQFMGFFFMAWQSSSIQSKKDQDHKEFTNSIYNRFIVTLSILASALILVSKFLIFYVTGSSYSSSWVLIPIITVGVFFRAISQFKNSVFYSFKRTGLIFLNSLVAVITYLFVGYFLVNYLELIGVAIAYLISEIVYAVNATNQSRNILSITLIKRNRLLTMSTLIFSITSYYLLDSRLLLYILLIYSIILLAVYFQSIKKIIEQILVKT